MPQDICGMDIDDILKLAAPKYVYIRDWKLGALKYILMICIFGYVIGYDILYSCMHLVPHMATGYGNIALKHPTAYCDGHRCKSNYKNIADLPYCTEKINVKDSRTTQEKPKSKDDGDSESGIGDFITTPAMCRYLDNDRLTLTEVPNELFVPLRYVSYEQEIGNDCYDPLVKPLSGHNARKKSKKHFDCKQPWKTTNRSEFYVADIEHFDLVLKHSYISAAIGLSGASTGMAGFMKSCSSTHVTSTSKCVTMRIPNTDYSPKYCAPEDLKKSTNASEHGIYTLNGAPGGEDVISIGDLFKLTPVAHHYKWSSDIADRKMPGNLGHPTESLRDAGGMLMLSVSYDNTGYGRPGFPHVDFPSISLGAIKPITYTYRPYFIPTDNNKKVEVLFRNDKTSHRTVNIWYGITVKLSFDGQLSKFSMTVLLTTLTTALVLVSSGTTIVSLLALYVMKAADKYTLMMYQYTEDFSDYKEMVENAAKPGHTKCAVATPASYVLAMAHHLKRSLKPYELLNVLTDYQVRLNRLDGKDPELAFPANPTSQEVEDVAFQAKRTFYERWKQFEETFLIRAKNWKEGDTCDQELMDVPGSRLSR